MKNHYKIFKYIILFLTADWFYIQQSVIPGFGKYNIRIGDLFFVYFFVIYFKYIFNKNVKKTLIHYFYIFFLVANIVPIYWGTLNTQLSYALRDFQVVSFSIAFFVGLFVINDINEIKKIINLFFIAFLLRELFLLFTLGPQIGYINRLLTLADTSQTSFIHNMAVLLLLYYFFISIKKWIKIINFSLIIYLSLTIIMLGKIGGIITLFFSITVFALYSINFSNILKYATIMAAFLILISVYSNSEFISQSLFRISILQTDVSADPTSQWRLSAWIQGLDIFVRNPLFGGGYSWPDGWLYVPTDSDTVWGWGTMLHNGYLHILSSGGIVGITPFLFFLVYIVYYILKNIRYVLKKNDKLLIACFFIAFVSFLITAFTNPTWIFHVSMVGWAFGSFAYRYVQLSLKENNIL